MKKLMLVVALVFALVLCAVLIPLNTNWTDSEDEKILRLDDSVVFPTDFPGTKWVSEDGSMWFIVKHDYHDQYLDENSTKEEIVNTLALPGFILTDDGPVEMKVLEDDIFGLRISFREKNDELFPPATEGKYECTNEKLIVTIDKDNDDFDAMKGKYDTIVFYSEQLSEEELETERFDAN